MAWSDPKTWTADDLLTASDLNQYLSDNTAALYALVQGGGRKNLLHNGAFQVHQRGTSTASITTANYYTADRWYFQPNALGTWTQSVENDAPTGSGFRKSFKCLITANPSPPDADDYVQVFQAIEGQNLQSVKKGTADAQPLTVSFWVKSNKTGTYIARLNDVDNTRNVSAAYTIDASGTWEQKTITFPADATGAFDNDNAASLYMFFYLAAGSDRTSGTLATVWEAKNTADMAVGQTNLASDTNNYWQVTGVQLETGSAATGFEFKGYGQELAECQRYYYRHATGDGCALCTAAAFNTGQVRGSMQFPVTMRTVPALDAPTGTNYYSAEAAWVGGPDYFNSLTIYEAGINAAIVYNSTEISATAGQACTLNTAHASSYVGFSADL